MKTIERNNTPTYKCRYFDKSNAALQSVKKGEKFI